ncbi:MAG TPA: hypothetical protein VFC19_00300, partial [Candidatus Limnocylindrales bacterium]|nr:hypothetical protein [Candidatus Limnocylindrales bacterium]
YDSAQLTLDLTEERVAVLVRLRSDRCFTPIRHQRRVHPGAAGHAATAPSSTAPMQLPGRPRPPPLAAATTSTAP